MLTFDLTFAIRQFSDSSPTFALAQEGASMGLITQPTTALVGNFTQKVLRVSGLRGTTKYLVKDHLGILLDMIFFVNCIPTLPQSGSAEKQIGKKVKNDLCYLCSLVQAALVFFIYKLGQGL
ncbi:MAG: hypothetical protein JRG68_00470 [Deltaproteobacteria bacterium]|nr:hypothetical protein [Deltaproteobacteria bacterium]